jgi:hypothetical protein
MKLINGTLTSTDKDWTNSKGETIAIWPGTILPVEQYSDFVNFFKKEFETDVEVIGTLMYGENECVVFVCSNMSGSFPVKRLELGVRWWYDFFWEVNGGKVMSELTNIDEILSKLGLEIE